MNLFGITHFNRALVADPLAERLGRRVELGRLNWHADSYHVYGKDQRDFEARFLSRLAAAPFEDCAWRFHSPEIQEVWREAGEAVERKIAEYRG